MTDAIQDIHDLEQVFENAVNAPKANRQPRIPVLTAEQLTSEQGFPLLFKAGPHLKFKGKGSEEEDLRQLMNFYKSWAKELAPKLTFKAFIDKVDKLSRARTMRGYWKEATGRINPKVAAQNLVGEDDNEHFGDEMDMSNQDNDQEEPNDEPVVQQRRIISSKAAFGFGDDEEIDQGEVGKEQYLKQVEREIAEIATEEVENELPDGFNDFI